MCEFEAYDNVQKMWHALEIKLGRISTTRLCGLTMRFDSDNMRFGHMMKQHLRKMSTMIHKLKMVRNNLTGEQQVQVVTRSLPNSWKTMMS